MNKQQQEYIEKLNEIEKRVLEVAKQHFGDAFKIKNTIGFIKDKQSNNKLN